MPEDQAALAPVGRDQALAVRALDRALEGRQVVDTLGKLSGMLGGIRAEVLVGARDRARGGRDQAREGREAAEVKTQAGAATGETTWMPSAGPSASSRGSGKKCRRL